MEIISNLDTRPKLLLHSCCGPCSTAVLSFLVPYFDITVLYYNPNIEPYEEYLKRKNEQIRFIKEYQHKEINFLDCDYDNESFRNKVKGLEHEKEGGARCPVCYRIRLEFTAIKAKEMGYDYENILNNSLFRGDYAVQIKNARTHGVSGNNSSVFVLVKVIGKVYGLA